MSIYIIDNDTTKLAMEGQAVFANNTNYPAGWDLSTVSGLTKVIEVAQPTLTANQTANWTVTLVDGVFTQVWNVVDIPQAVPQLVTLFQLKVALTNFGYFSEIDSYMNVTATPIQKLAWTDGDPVPRSSPMVNLIGKTILNLTDAQIDAVFIAAGIISV